ncbi:MAG: PKD domain-containing protein, partial [Actinomycetota bacterium]
EDVQPRAWSLVGQRCQGPTDSASPQEIPAFTLADFQRLPLPAGTPNVQPDNGYTLVGVPTNVYATAEPVTLDTTLLGFPVQVRATPSRYAWDFGDGNGHGPTSEPGAPYPALTITHTYERADRYPITLTTYYTGEYSVAGGPWLPIAGEAQVTSAPVDVEALAGRNRLVADPQG